MGSVSVGMACIEVGEESRELRRVADDVAEIHRDVTAVLRSIDRAAPGVGALVAVGELARRCAVDLEQRSRLAASFDHQLGGLPILPIFDPCVAVPVGVPLGDLWTWIADDVVPLWRGDHDTFPIVGWLSTADSLAKVMGKDPLRWLSQIAVDGSKPFATLGSGPLSGMFGVVSIASNAAGAANDLRSLVRRGNPLTAAADDPLGFTVDLSGAVAQSGLAAYQVEPALVMNVPLDVVVVSATAVYLGAELWDHVDGVEQFFDDASSWAGDQVDHTEDLGGKIVQGAGNVVSHGVDLLDDLVPSWP